MPKNDAHAQSLDRHGPTRRMGLKARLGLVRYHRQRAWAFERFKPTGGFMWRHCPASEHGHEGSPGHLGVMNLPWEHPPSRVRHLEVTRENLLRRSGGTQPPASLRASQCVWARGALITVEDPLRLAIESV